MPTKQHTRPRHPLTELGERILSLQEIEGLKPYELAEKLGISSKSLSEIKHGHIKGLKVKFWKGITREFPQWERYLKGLDDSPPSKRSKRRKNTPAKKGPGSKALLDTMERGAMHKIGKTSSGNILVEISIEQWAHLAKEILGPQELSSEIKEYRMRHGLTLGEFSQRLGISRNTMSKIESGLNYDIIPLKLYKRIVSLIFE
jgi:transcriptional regulator with XRE-family HTH domain